MMKRKGIISLIICFTLVMSIFITSCGSKEPETLEAYLANNPDAAAEIQEASDSSGLEVSITGNDVTYTYDLKNFDGMTEELAKSDELVKSLSDAISENADNFSQLCASLEESSKIEGIQIIVNYTYDGEVLTSATFNSAGIVE